MALAAHGTKIYVKSSSTTPTSSGGIISDLSSAANQLGVGQAIDLLKGMEGMLAAGLMMGVARAISVVLTDGKVIDSIIHGLSLPLGGMPSAAGALAMIPVHALLHIAVPSVSGHGVLTMPIMAPTADLIHVSRDAAVIAYQTGSGLMDLITPTNGILLAILIGARVNYGRWIKFAGPGALLVALVGAIGVVLAA